MYSTMESTSCECTNEPELRSGCSEASTSTDPTNSSLKSSTSEVLYKLPSESGRRGQSHRVSSKERRFEMSGSTFDADVPREFALERRRQDCQRPFISTRKCNFSHNPFKIASSANVLLLLLMLFVDGTASAPVQPHSSAVDRSTHKMSELLGASGGPNQADDDALVWLRKQRFFTRREKRHISAAETVNDKQMAEIHADDDTASVVPSGENAHWHQVAMNYLFEFGYLSSARAATRRQFHGALRTFQDMAGLAVTGRLDAETVEAMMQPRCGNSDVSRGSERRKRFVYISRWENKVHDNVLKLKWYIENYTEDIPRNVIKDTVRKAFHLWSSQVKISAMESLTLEFEEASDGSDADITILWAEADHGDAHKFDGPGQDGSNILAHTFYPNYQSRGTLNGDIHLDDYETWNVNNSKEGASFPHVLVHEIGHTLGLGHSKKQQAIMYPIYRKEQLDLMQLDLDDKCAINWSYIGASDLCLYIWLLSEVLPKKIAIEKDATYMVDDTNVLWENGVKSGEHLTESAFERRLKNTLIPVCRDDNQVQTHVERMLVQRLTFPRELAEQYSEVLCRFFDGMQNKYNTPVTSNFHEVFRMHGVHNYFQEERRFQALETDVQQNRQFDEEFFRWLTTAFLR